MSNVEAAEKNETSWIEVVVVILMGITATLTAFASWEGSLYGGNQATKYAQGTSKVAEANSMYNEASQLMAADMSLWTRISDLRIDKAFAEAQKDEDVSQAIAAEQITWKIDQITSDAVGKELAEAIAWADEQTEYASPFEMEGFVDGYYTASQGLRVEGEAEFAAGEKDNQLGDQLGLVTVIFAMVLFLLGIAAYFKSRMIRIVATGIATVALVVGVVLMLQVPIIWPEMV